MEMDEIKEVSEDTMEEEVQDIPEEEIVPEKSEELIAAEERAAFLEAKIFCIENGIIPNFAEDVITLAQNYIGDKDINSAILSVLEKYPFFKKEKEREEKRSVTTGIHIEAGHENPCGGVEAAFKKSNPYIKL